MRRPGREGECWPTLHDELLLRAGLLGEPEASRAWASERSSIGSELDAISGDSLKLVPLVYRNLVGLGIDDPLLPRLRGIYRRTWYRNQILFHDVAGVLRALQNDGIDTLVLKGAALASQYYGDAGLRPMADADVLVPYEDARRAADLLARLGWRHPSVSLERLQRLRHGVKFEGPDGHLCDLHWRVMKLLDRPGVPESGTFWRGAVALEVSGIETRTLNAADHLLHVCAHGVRWAWNPHVLWIPDMVTIVRSGAVDWERLVRQTRRFRATLIMRDALTYLIDVFDTPIPADVVLELERAPVSARDRYVHRVTLRPPRRGRMLRDFPETLRRYVRMSATLSLPRAAALFPRHVRDTYGLDSASDLARVAKKAFGRSRG